MSPTTDLAPVEVLFPMAGEGARFGHRFKPFLTIGSETFIEAAVRPFRAFSSRVSRFVFVYLEAQERQHAARSMLERAFHGLPIEIVLLPEPTRGPAETVARAVDRLGGVGRAFVCDCDHQLDVAPLFDARPDYDVLLPVWPLAGEDTRSWSVALVEGDEVRAIAEKRVPNGSGGNAMGVIGCYGFRDLGDVARRAAQIGATNFSDVIATMLAEGAAVRAAPIERATFFGDPRRLEKAQTRGDIP
jgi:hypothetical protein